ncbi:hypothetical protein TorRG33x02_031420, partial [Trema orientale]
KLKLKLKLKEPNLSELLTSPKPVKAPSFSKRRKQSVWLPRNFQKPKEFSSHRFCSTKLNATLFFNFSLTHQTRTHPQLHYSKTQTDKTLRATQQSKTDKTSKLFTTKTPISQPERSYLDLHQNAGS